MILIVLSNRHKQPIFESNLVSMMIMVVIMILMMTSVLMVLIMPIIVSIMILASTITLINAFNKIFDWTLSSVKESDNFELCTDTVTCDKIVEDSVYLDKQNKVRTTIKVKTL